MTKHEANRVIKWIMHGLAGNTERYCPLQHHCNAPESTSRALWHSVLHRAIMPYSALIPVHSGIFSGRAFLLLFVTLCIIHAIFTMSFQTVSNAIQEVCNRQASLLELYFKCIDPYDKWKIRAWCSFNGRILMASQKPNDLFIRAKCQLSLKCSNCC